MGLRSYSVMVPGGPGALCRQERGSHLSLTLMWTKKGTQVTVEESTDSPMGPKMDAKVSVITQNADDGQRTLGVRLHPHCAQDLKAVPRRAHLVEGRQEE